MKLNIKHGPPRLWLLYDSEPTELLLSIFASVIGVVLTIASARGLQTNATSTLMQMAPLPVWAGLFLLIGVGTFYSLIVGRLRWRLHLMRVGMLLWFYFATLFIERGQIVSGIGFFLVCGIGAALSYLQLSHRVQLRNHN